MPDDPEDRERQCKNCREYQSHTGVHDDARGGWLWLGHCTDPLSPRGLVAYDFGCANWARRKPLSPEQRGKDA